MTRMYSMIACVSGLLLLAGCGVPRAEYLALKNQYRTTLSEKGEASRRINDLEQEAAKNAADMEDLQQQKKELESRCSLLDARVKTLAWERENARSDALKSQQQASQARAELTEALAAIKSYEARMSQVDAAMAQVRARAEKLQVEINEMLGKVKSYTAQAEEFKATGKVAQEQTEPQKPTL